MGRLDEIEAAGAGLVFLGNGSVRQAAHFAEREVPGQVVLTDPSRDAYRALKMRRGLRATLSPRSAGAAIGAALRGHRQTSVEGDPWQQGGLLVLGSQGRILFLQQNSDAGDRPDLEGALKTLRRKAVPSPPGGTAPRR